MSTERVVSIVSKLVLPQAYQAQRRNIFPSPSSLEHWARNNRDHLIEASALLMFGGRWWIHPDRFDDCVIKAGQRAAKMRSAR